MPTQQARSRWYGAVIVAAAAAFSACGSADPSGPTPTTTNCPANKTMFYCSSQGYGCTADTDCCGGLVCDPATRACTDGGVTGLFSGFHCSPSSPCITDLDPSAREHLDAAKSWPVYCQQRICRWVDPGGKVAYCSNEAQACNQNADCCAAANLWCDQVTGTCTKGATTVPSGYRCSNQTLCRDFEKIGGRDQPLYCDSDGICKWPPYCAP